MNDDALLLRRYVDEGSEKAFTELVRRHVDLVYGAALRRTNGDLHRAAEVAQHVFTALAGEARKLTQHTVLPAWLHTATRNAALNLMIAEQRRKKREAEALALESVNNNSDAPDWERVKPILDEAIDELSETDRAAVVLRFLGHRPFAEIGAALSVSEDAARMRTERALEKLRQMLGRRGITSTATALGSLVSAQPLLSAPAGLATTLATQSLSAAGAGVVTTIASFMTTKLIATALLSAFVAFGVGTYVGLKHETPVQTPTSTPASSDQTQLITSLRRDNQQLTDRIAGLNADVARLNSANANLAANRSAPAASAAIPKSPNIGLPLYELQQAVLNNLRQIDSARSQFQHDNGRPAKSVKDLVGIKGYIKTVRTVGGEDYSALSMVSGQPLTVTTPDGASVTFDPSGAATTQLDMPPAVIHAQDLGKKVEASAMKAVSAYRAAHGGDNPPNEEAVIPFFTTPQEGADYVEFMEARVAAGL